MVVKVWILLFRVVTPCGLSGGAYQYFVELVVTIFRVEMNQILKGYGVTRLVREQEDWPGKSSGWGADGTLEGPEGERALEE